MLTWATWKTAIANLTVVSETALTDMYPLAIDYAEGRCYRDLDLNDTIVRDATSTTTANTRTFTLPTPSTNGYYTIVDSVNIIVAGSRTPVLATTQAYIDFIWPTATAASATTVPVNYAMVTDQSLIWGPPPGGSFTVEIVGKTRPALLSATNTTTILTTYYPELYVAASMVFAAGWLKNYGQMADDPKMASSWDSEYQKLLRSAVGDDERSQSQGDSWTANRASSVLSNQRG